MRPKVTGVNLDLVRGILLCQEFLESHIKHHNLTKFTQYFYEEDDLADMSTQQRLDILSEHLEYQTRDLFVHMHDIDNMCKATKVICSATESPYHFDYPGFSLKKIQHTKSPQGGEGCFCEGRIRKGQIVALFPGLVFHDYDTWVVNYGTDEISDCWDPSLHRRIDGTCVDGATNVGAWRATVEGQHAMHHPDLVATQECGTLPNSYALGQYMTHPPKGEVSNILPLSLDLGKNVIHQKLVPYIPNQYFPSREQFNQTHIDFRLGTDNSTTLMKMVVMIATKDIENEEIFVDYRLDPDSPCPDWYHVVDPKELRKFHRKTGISGRVRGWWRRRQSTRYEVYKGVMAERRMKHLDDLPESLGGKKPTI